MSLKNLLVAVAFVALGTFAAVEFVMINSLTRELDSLKERPPVPAIPGAQEVAATKIICPLCNGEEYIMVSGAGDNPLYKRRQVCPLCRGAGSKMLAIPLGRKIWSDCQGMGVVYFRYQDDFIQVSACARCAGTGLIADAR